LRANAKLGDKVNLLLGAYYFNEKINQTGALRYGSQMRSYADLLIRGASGNTLNVASLEGLSARCRQSGEIYRTILQVGHGSFPISSGQSISIFGQMD
jgi:hypothetical protein